MTADVLWFTPDKPDNISVGRRMIAEHLDDEGYDVTLRATTAGTARRSLSDAERYDALVGTTRAGAFAATTLARARNVPLVIDHVDPIRQFAETSPPGLSVPVRHAENAAFRLADHVLYVYEEEAERASRWAPTTKTALGLEYDRFVDPDEAAVDAARETLAERGVTDKVVLYVGGLEPIYHIAALLDAMDHLEGWTLAVLGTGSLSDEVRRRSDERDDVEYLGCVAHEAVPGYLHAADVGISLVDDPHTLKVLEYGAAGLPVVQRAGRAEERFGNMVTYCQPVEHNVARAIVEAYHRGPSDPLRSFVEQYRWSNVARTYADVFDDVLESSRETRPPINVPSR